MGEEFPQLQRQRFPGTEILRYVCNVHIGSIDKDVRSGRFKYQPYTRLPLQIGYDDAR